MNPIDLGGQKVKVTMDIHVYGDKFVNTIETKPLCISSSNLAEMLTMVRDRREISCELKVTMDIYGDKLVNTIPW